MQTYWLSKQQNFILQLFQFLLTVQKMEMLSDDSCMRVSQAEIKRLRSPQQNNRGLKRKVKASYHNEPNTQIRKDLLQRFQQFNIAQSLIRILVGFKTILGRHSAIKYDSSKHNFKEQWQITKEQIDKESYKASIIQGCFKFILLLFMNCSALAVSVKLVFQVNKTQWTYLLVAITCFLKILQNLQNILPLPNKYKVKAISKEIACILCSILLLTYDDQGLIFCFIGIAIIILLYLSSSELYQNLKIFHVSSKYRQIVDIIDLFALLLTFSHIFALLLYATTLLNPERNWLTRLTLQNQQWFTKYVYSLYFSCTTLLTVGYGDIVPTNVMQIITILLTELIGVATFAYAVNQIGAALTSITERTQKMQKDLGNVEQVGNQYHLKPEIVRRMRTQVTKDRALDSQINIKQQNQLFSKLSEDLRSQIQLQSSLRVIKRSMFMIANWTGKFQSKIAKRLIKQIYTVDQCLPQQYRKEKIYIIDKGKVQITSNTRMGSKTCFQRVIKVLSAEPDNQVLLENVYGYSAVISNRPISLNAVAKSNVICYSVPKSVINQILAESPEDWEHFHEIKSQIDLCKIPQQVEAPSIVKFTEHYCPSVHYIIAHNRSKDCKKNVRTRLIRNQRRVAMRCYNQTMPQIIAFSRREKIAKTQTEQILSLGKLSQLDERRHQTQKLNKQWQILSGIHVQSEFESCKQYQRYFKKSNYSNIVNKLKIRNCKETIRRKKSQYQTFKLKSQHIQKI